MQRSWAIGNGKAQLGNREWQSAVGQAGMAKRSSLARANAGFQGVEPFGEPEKRGALL
jgi:hypothetical protein